MVIPILGPIILSPTNPTLLPILLFSILKLYKKKPIYSIDNCVDIIKEQLQKKFYYNYVKYKLSILRKKIIKRKFFLKWISLVIEKGGLVRFKTEKFTVTVETTDFYDYGFKKMFADQFNKKILHSCLHFYNKYTKQQFVLAWLQTSSIKVWNSMEEHDTEILAYFRRKKFYKGNFLKYHEPLNLGLINLEIDCLVKDEIEKFFKERFSKERLGNFDSLTNNCNVFIEKFCEDYYPNISLVDYDKIIELNSGPYKINSIKTSIRNANITVGCSAFGSNISSNVPI